jgi:hypothetical protein
MISSNLLFIAEGVLRFCYDPWLLLGFHRVSFWITLIRES